MVLPPLDSTCESITQDKIDARALIVCMHAAINDAKDNLMVAKISQAFEANKTHSVDTPFLYKIGDSVLLSTLHRHSAFISSDDKRAAKFLLRFDDPYIVTDTFPCGFLRTLWIM